MFEVESVVGNVGDKMSRQHHVVRLGLCRGARHKVRPPESAGGNLVKFVEDVVDKHKAGVLSQQQMVVVEVVLKVFTVQRQLH